MHTYSGNEDFAAQQPVNARRGDERATSVESWQVAALRMRVTPDAVVRGVSACARLPSFLSRPHKKTPG
jgi:hypothetical protein